MKVLKELAIMAVVTAILFAGCANSFSGTDSDTGVLSRANSADNTSIGTLTAPGVGGTLTQAVDQIITLTFTAANVVDSDTITKAVVIRNLTEAASATAVRTRGSTISYTLKEIRGNIAYLQLDLTGASATLEVFIDPTKLTGKKGTLKLDRDGDNVQGEAGDDDFYSYPTVTGGTAITTLGLPRDPRAGMGDLTGAFSVAGVATTLNTFISNYTRQGGTDNADYKAIFDASMVIEKYVPSTNKWVTVTSSTSTYDNTTGVYTVTFTALNAGENVRARYIDIQKLKTTAEFQGYIQRAVMDSQVTTSYGAFDSEADPLEINQANTNTVFSNANVNTVFTNGLKGLIVIDLDVTTGSIIGDLGMDESSFTAANVKIYDTSAGVFVPFESVAFGYGAGVIPAATTDPKDQIVITLDPEYAYSANGFDIYVGPGLKTLGDADLTPAARHFGDTTNIDTSELYGFRKAATTGDML